MDAPIYSAMHEGQIVDKQRRQRSAEIDGKKVDLALSPDFFAMLWAMPLTIVVCLILGIAGLTVPAQVRPKITSSRRGRGTLDINADRSALRPRL